MCDNALDNEKEFQTNGGEEVDDDTRCTQFDLAMIKPGAHIVLSGVRATGKSAYLEQLLSRLFRGEKHEHKQLAVISPYLERQWKAKHHVDADLVYSGGGESDPAVRKQSLETFIKDKLSSRSNPREWMMLIVEEAHDIHSSKGYLELLRYRKDHAITVIEVTQSSIKYLPGTTAPDFLVGFNFYSRMGEKDLWKLWECHLIPWTIPKRRFQDFEQFKRVLQKRTKHLGEVVIFDGYRPYWSECWWDTFKMWE